jgi:hypothetical protein
MPPSRGLLCVTIKRKWERGEFRSYDLIADQISNVSELWRSGKNTYY